MRGRLFFAKSAHQNLSTTFIRKNKCEETISWGDIQLCAISVQEKPCRYTHHPTRSSVLVSLLSPLICHEVSLPLKLWPYIDGVQRAIHSSATVHEGLPFF